MSLKIRDLAEGFNAVLMNCAYFKKFLQDNHVNVR